MEPADDRPDDPADFYLKVVLPLPQWSRPVVGRMTLAGLQILRELPQSAMGAAVRRWYDGDVERDRHLDDGTALELAVDRPDDASCIPSRSCHESPQWSRPLVGRMTGSENPSSGMVTPLQWSRPGVGQMTRPMRRAGRGCACRNRADQSLAG